MSITRSVTTGQSTLTFVGRFVRRPGTVGSIVPSTPQLAAAMVAPIVTATRATGTATQRRAPMTIVELGPGTGAFTSAIVRLLRGDDRFLAVEIDRVFCDLVRRRWPDVDAACGSAEALAALLEQRQWPSADHIVSGLPFATLPIDTSGRIVEAIGRSLHPGGTFTTFHYAHSFATPRAKAFRRHTTDLLRAFPTTTFVGYNLPPAVTVSWTKD